MHASRPLSHCIQEVLQRQGHQLVLHSLDKNSHARKQTPVTLHPESVATSGPPVSNLTKATTPKYCHMYRLSSHILLQCTVTSRTELTCVNVITNFSIFTLKSINLSIFRLKRPYRCFMHLMLIRSLYYFGHSVRIITIQHQELICSHVYIQTY